VRWVRFTAGLSIAITFLWLALRHIRIDDLVGALTRVQRPWLVIALVALVGGYTARVYRWWWMLRICNPKVKLKSCFWPLVVGFAINNVVPFRAGDMVRAIGFREQLDTPAVRLFGTLLLERILDLTVLLVLLMFGVFWLERNRIPTFYVRSIDLAAAVAAIGWAVLLFMGDRLEALCLQICRHRLVARRDQSRRAEYHVRQLFVALNIARTPESALKLLAMSAIVWSCEGGIFAAVASSLHYNGRPFGPWFALATGSLSTMIPSTPGYVGTFDYFSISGLAAYGAGQSVATAISFIVHGVLWLPLTFSGLTYLLIANLKGKRSPVIETQTPEQERT
jgi:uncharacterized protein (TIRG00374 family)